MSSTSKPHIPLVVLGAGVIGLTAAYVAACDPETYFDITIVARDMPGDWGSQAWASPFAGANWSPMPPSATNERVRKWERITFDKLWEMIPSGLVKRLPSKIFREIDDTLVNPWWKDLVRDFRFLSESEIPVPYKVGVTFDTVSINPLEYLPWLRSELESRGVVFHRQYVSSLDEVKPFVGNNGILVNATSLGSRSLIGVEDTALYPIRGQSIIVQSNGLQEFLSSRLGPTMSEGHLTSIIPRPGLIQTNTALLNGTYQIGNWDTSLDMSTAKGIFERCSALAPCLKEDETKILRHTVGLRPDRTGGPRVEAERISLPLTRSGSLLAPYVSENAEEEQQELTIIHAYGMGAGGYQRSWGVAFEVLSLLKENVQQAAEI